VGKATDYVPTQLSKAFRDAQSNEQFLSWVKMQDAVMDIEFPYEDAPELRDEMFTKDSLGTIEAKLIEKFPNHRVAYDGNNVHTTMRFVFYVGETFRRQFEGQWVNLPASQGFKPAVDFPMREALIRPADLVKIALNRRTGHEILDVYGYAERDYEEWTSAGKPERTFLGTLRD
jgi:hypothetical protein